ncbi:MAG: hypothetical protein ACOX0R_01070 [Candidatus Dojkabacteria bacterium]|jgi:predicted acyltransferase (DUF342 family)
MKKIFSLIALPILIVLMLGVLVPNRSQAAEFSFKEQYTLQTGKNVNDDLYLFGDTAKINGTINGDLVSFGKNFQLNGYVAGNVYVFAENILIGENTQIQGNLTLFAYKAQIEGVVSDNATLFASSIIHSGFTGKDLIVFTADNNLSGDVGDDLRVFASTSNVKGNVRGDVIMLAQQYNIDETKVGSKIYDAKEIEKIAKSQGVEIDKEEKEWIPKEVTWGVKINNVIIGFTSMLIAGAFLIFMAPVKTGLVLKKINTSTEELLKSFGIGLAVLFFAWIPIIFLLISVVGIPLAGILTAFLIFTIIFGGVWVELAIGREILRLFKIKDYRPFKSFLIGRVVTTIVKLIPFIGGLYSFVVTSVALGAFVRMKKDFFDKQNLAIIKKDKKK